MFITVNTCNIYVLEICNLTLVGLFNKDITLVMYFMKVTLCPCFSNYFKEIQFNLKIHLHYFWQFSNNSYSKFGIIRCAFKSYLKNQF